MTGLDAYRQQARAWLAEQAPAQGWLPTGPDGSADGATAEYTLARARRAQAALFEAGYTGISWPPEYGGQGLSNREQVVFNQESEPYDLPVFPFLIGLGMCGPTVLSAGTPEQKERYIRPMLRGEEIWCQMFSEPGAGSDVAASAPGRPASSTARGWCAATRSGRPGPSTATSGCSWPAVTRIRPGTPV